MFNEDDFDVDEYIGQSGMPMPPAAATSTKEGEDLLRNYFANQMARQKSQGQELLSAEKRSANNEFADQMFNAGDTAAYAIAGVPRPTPPKLGDSEAPLKRLDRRMGLQNSQDKLIQNFILSKYRGDAAAKAREDQVKLRETIAQGTNAHRAHSEKMAELGLEERKKQNQNQFDFNKGMFDWRKEEAQEKKDIARKETEVPGYDFSPGARPTADDAKKLKDSAVASDNVSLEMERMRELVKDVGPEIWYGDAHDLMNQHLEAIKMELKNFYQLGALTGPDVIALTKLFPDPTSLRNWAKVNAGGKLMERFDIFERDLKARLENQAKRRGYVKRQEPLSPEQAEKVRRVKEGNPGVSEQEIIDDMRMNHLL